MFSTVLRPVLRSSTIVARAVSPKITLSLRLSSIRFISTRYTQDHEWVKLDESTNIGTIGITEYAQKALGDVVFVELPAVGQEIGVEDTIGAVESVKAASDIYAPVSGKIEEINEKLSEQPGLLNKSPENDGWLCKVRLTAPNEFENLMNAEAYKAHCEGEEEHEGDH